MKVKELVELINSAEDLYSLYAAESLIKNKAKYKSSIDRDAHRWYSVSTDIYECEDGFVGIRGVSELFSENMIASDCDYPCEAQEYEEIKVISYKVKES